MFFVMKMPLWLAMKIDGIQNVVIMKLELIRDMQAVTQMGTREAMWKIV